MFSGKYLIRKILDLLILTILLIIPVPLFSLDITDIHQYYDLRGELIYSLNGNKYVLMAEWARIIPDCTDENQLQISIGFEDTDLALDILLHHDTETEKWSYRNFQISVYDETRLCLKASVSPLSPRADVSIRTLDSCTVDFNFTCLERQFDLSQTAQFSSWKMLPRRHEVIQGFRNLHLSFNNKGYPLEDISSEFSGRAIRMLSIPVPELSYSGNDPAQVALELVQGVEDPGRRLKIIHDWICREIFYDKHPGRRGHISLYSPFDIIDNNRAVCGGFASLFQYMAEAAGLPLLTISGTAINDGKPEPHAWNAVKINGEIFFIDVTWDCRNTVDQWGYHYSDFNNRYFLVEPEEFILSHIPSIDEYRFIKNHGEEHMLNPPIVAYGSFFDYGGSLSMSHRSLDDSSVDYLEVELNFDNSIIDKSLSADILSNIKSESDDSSYKTSVYIKKDKSRYTLLIPAALEGLKVCRVGLLQDEKIIPLLEIPIDNAENQSSKVVFPLQNISFQRLEFNNLSPERGLLKKGSEQLFYFESEKIVRAEIWSYSSGEYLNGQEMDLLDNSLSLWYYVPERAEEIRVLVYDISGQVFNPLTYKVVP